MVIAIISKRVEQVFSSWVIEDWANIYPLTRVESHSAANTTGLKIKDLAEWLFASPISFHKFLRALGPGWTNYSFTQSAKSLNVER